MTTKNFEKGAWEIPVCKYGTIYVPYSKAPSAEAALMIVEEQEYDKSWVEDEGDWQTMNDPDEIELIDEDGIPF